MLLSLDPGRQGFGWAAIDARKLVACGVVPQPDKARDYQQVAARSVASGVALVIRQALSERCDLRLMGRVVLERMVHYPPSPGAKIKQDERTRTKVANDLLDLQLIGALVAAALCPLMAITLRAAREWKGSTDTAVLERRLLEGLGTVPPLLDEHERALLLAVKPAGLRHNAVDAISLGLQECGRVRWV
jgi:hypothetical protein